jgi:hypothetical protein
MSNFFTSVIASASQAQINRLKSVSEKASLPQPIQIGSVTGFDSSTGEFIVTTADGGIQAANLGNFGAPPSQVSLSTTKNSYTTFADFRAPQ